VGWLNAELALVILHGDGGGVADAAIGAAGVEAKRGKPALDLLDFGNGGWRLAVGEPLNKRRTADAGIAEVDEPQRVAQGRVKAARGEKVGSEQESRAAGDRHPGTRRCMRLRVGLAVCANNSERMPGGVAA